MIALIILFCIVLLFVLICLVKLDFTAVYTDSLTLKLKVLFLNFTLVPKKKKDKKKKPTKTKKKKKADDTKSEDESYIKKLSDKKGMEGIVPMLIRLSKLAASTLKGVVSHTVIKQFDIKLSVVGEDAADTALKYGKICSVFYPAVTIVCETAKCRDYSLDVTPDFSEDAKATVYGKFRFHIRAFYVLKYGLKALVQLILIRYKR